MKLQVGDLSSLLDEVIGFLSEAPTAKRKMREDTSALPENKRKMQSLAITDYNLKKSDHLHQETRVQALVQSWQVLCVFF